MVNSSSSLARNQVFALLIWLSTFPITFIDSPLKALWPSFVALSIVLLIRRVLVGLLAGAFAGTLILAHGNPVFAFVSFFSKHLIPTFESNWKVGAIIFTLILGGFSALIEKGGGFRGLVHFYLLRGKYPGKRVQWSAFVLGLICFFDGLANSMMVGRIFRSLADRCQVSRVKLAYIVDSTSSAVTCLAFVSTWIAYQLAMIQEGLEQTGQVDQWPLYAVFFNSIPYNFYCLFTLFLLAIVLYRNFNIGPMRDFEETTRFENPDEIDAVDSKETFGAIYTAVTPVVILIVGMLAGMYWSGSDSLWPVSFEKISVAFGKADSALVLVCVAALASIFAYFLFPRSKSDRETPSRIFHDGVVSLFFPVLILISAWTLSSTLNDLKAAHILTGILSQHLPVFALPAAVFLVGALISFSTGTSWGTMGILMPLSVPVVLNLTSGMEMSDQSAYLSAIVAAVFSGAVFGDHCSPISDTTIVSSIACDIEPHDHVRTQMPYALIAGGAAIFFGFLPTGFGLSPWLSILIGFSFLAFLPNLARGRSS